MGGCTRTNSSITTAHNVWYDWNGIMAGNKWTFWYEKNAWVKGIDKVLRANTACEK